MDIKKTSSSLVFKAGDWRIGIADYGPEGGDHELTFFDENNNLIVTLTKDQLVKILKIYQGLKEIKIL